MFSRKGLIHVLFLVSCILFPVLVLAQATSIHSFIPAGKLIADDGSAGHNFGHALDIDGQTAAIGAPSWNNTGNTYQGAAYIYTSDGGGWIERARLVDGDGAHYEGFGVDLVLDGGTLAVGVFSRNRPAPNFTIDAGAVVIYTGAGSTWTKQAALMPDDLVELNFFGRSVDLDGDTLLVGAPTYGSTENQSAYVFTRSGTTWTQQGKLTPPDELVDRSFGNDVALVDDVALVGAPGAGEAPLTRGAVHVFIRSGDAWTPAGTITPNDGEDGDLFGCAIDFDGQTAVIGACEAYGMPPGPGKTYVFVRQGNTWTQQAKLIPNVDDLALDVDSVALYGDRIVLGSSEAHKAVGEWYTGAAFVYERQGTEWALTQTLYAADARTDDYFGQSVALSADALLVGAPRKTVLNNAKQGVTYAFNYEDNVERPEKVYLPVVVRPGAVGAPGDLIWREPEAGR